MLVDIKSFCKGICLYSSSAFSMSSSNIVVDGGWLWLGLILIFSLHVLLLDEWVDPSRHQAHLKREPKQTHDLCNKFSMSDGLFALECFHNSGIYQEFTVCKYSLMNSFRFLFTFFLLINLSVSWQKLSHCWDSR